MRSTQTKTGTEDKRNRKWSSIEAGVDAIAIAANSCCHRCGAETACTEEGGESEDWAELCDHLQLLPEWDVGHLVLLLEGEEVLDAGLADGEEGAAESATTCLLV